MGEIDTVYLVQYNEKRESISGRVIQRAGGEPLRPSDFELVEKWKALGYKEVDHKTFMEWDDKWILLTGSYDSWDTIKKTILKRRPELKKFYVKHPESD